MLEAALFPWCAPAPRALYSANALQPRVRCREGCAHTSAACREASLHHFLRELHASLRNLEDGSQVRIGVLRESVRRDSPDTITGFFLPGTRVSRAHHSAASTPQVASPAASAVDVCLHAEFAPPVGWRIALRGPLPSRSRRRVEGPSSPDRFPVIDCSRLPLLKTIARFCAAWAARRPRRIREFSSNGLKALRPDHAARPGLRKGCERERCRC